jgi:hypothetical protein
MAMSAQIKGEVSRRLSAQTPVMGIEALLRDFTTIPLKQKPHQQ